MRIPVRRRLLSTALVVWLALVMTACVADHDAPTSAGSPESRWGPLAVIPPQDGADSARAEGTLRITGTCVHLESGDERALLIWPSDRTHWDAASRSITFRNVDGSIVTVGHGDDVVVGGGSGEIDGMTWVARPSADCSLRPSWGVGDIRR